MKYLRFFLAMLVVACSFAQDNGQDRLRNVMTTKGDTISTDGHTAQRLPTCPDGQSRVADTTQALGWRCTAINDPGSLHYYVSTVTVGADLGAKIATLIGTLPATGGVIDATGMVGAQAISTDIFAGTSGHPVTLLLGNATITCPISPIVNSACINVPSNVRLIGAGRTHTIITVANGWNQTFYRLITNVQGATDFEIAHLQVDGNQANPIGSLDRNVRQEHCVFVQIGVRFSVHDTIIHDCLGDGIEVWGNATPSQHGKVYNNYVHDHIQGGITWISATNLEIYSNLVDPGAVPLFSGIHGEPSSIGQWGYEISVHDNTLLNGDNISTTTQVGNGNNSSHTSIRNNWIFGGNSTYAAGTPIYVARTPYSEVSGNHVIGTCTDNAIYIASHDTKVLNNYIMPQGSSCPTYTPTNFAAAIYVTSASANDGSGEAAGYGNNSIQGNTVEGYRRTGIQLASSSWNIVSGNKIRNTVVSGTGTNNSNGIYQSSAGGGVAHNNQITNNIITDTQGTPTTKYGISWDSIDSPPNAAWNDISNMSVASYFGALNAATQTAGLTSTVVTLNNPTPARINVTFHPSTWTTATSANPILVTMPAHNLPTGVSTVWVAGGTGDWTAVNGSMTVTWVSTTQYSIAIDGSAFAAFSGQAITALSIGVTGLQDVAAANALNQTLTLMTWPANAKLHDYRLKPTVAVTGPTTAKYGFGTSSSVGAFLAASTGDWEAAVSSSNMYNGPPPATSSGLISTADVLTLRITTTGTNVNTITNAAAMAVDIVYSVLP